MSNFDPKKPPWPWEEANETMNRMDGDWPEGFIEEILTLLDRIEMEENYELAGQRFEIGRKYGLTVEFGPITSGAIN